LGLSGVEALAWTTTPWTLPTNQALAVGPEIRYVLIPAGSDADPVFVGRSFLLARDLVGSYAKELGYDSADTALQQVDREFTGADLEGLRYTPVFDYYTDTEKYGTEDCWQIF